jgi:hypothetical protein
MSVDPKRVLLPVFSAVVLVLATSVQANAASRILHDPSGDAPKSADITRARLVNGSHKVTASVKVVNLANGSDITLYVNHAGPGRYVLRTGGNGKGSLHFARGFNEKRVSCPGWTLARHTGPRSTMVVTIPQHCFGKRAGTAKFNFTMYQSGGTGADTIGALPVRIARG